MSTLPEQYEEMSPDQLKGLLSNNALEPDAKRLCEEVLRKKLGVEPPTVDDNRSDISNLLRAKGRFSRLSYIAWFILIDIVYRILQAAADQLLQISGQGVPDPATPYVGVITLLLQLTLLGLSLYALIVIAIRRFHDMNIEGIQAGWLLLPIVNIIFLGILMLKPGTPDANRYGPPRATLAWEKVLGLIGATIMTLLALAIIFVLAVAIVDPEFRQTIDWADFIS